MNQINSYIAALISVALFSSVEVATKLLGKVAYPFELVFIRFFFTGIILLTLVMPDLIRKGIRIRWQDIKIIMLNAVIGIAISISLFHWAIIKFEKAASAAVVFCTNPVFVIIFARFINQEEISIRKIIAVLFSIVGVSFFALETDAFSIESFSALIIMLLSAMCFGLSACICKKYVGHYGAMFFMGSSALLGSLIILPIVIPSVVINKPVELLQLWKTLCYITFFGTALPYALYYYSLKHVSAFSISMMNGMKPVMASIIAAIVLKEHINGFMIIGTLLVMTSLFINLIPFTKSQSFFLNKE